MTFQRLLLPIAPNQELGAAFHQAFQFADKVKAHVTLFTVIAELAEMKELSKYSVSTLTLLDEATKQSELQLGGYLSELKNQYPNITFELKVGVGIPFIEIIKEAAASSTDLIVIDAHRDDKDTACQFGTTTRHLMRKSSTPIWAIRLPEDKKPKINKIVVAIDVTDQDSTLLNEKLLQHSYEFASINQASLYPSHVWRLESEGYLREWNRSTDLEIAVVAKQMRDDRSARLEAIAKPYESSDTPIHITMLEGIPKKILPDYVNSHDIDLVIMGTVSRTGIAGFLMGNTAESMLDRIQCSVITLKPDEFKSPVLEE
ncbi:universal stress protein [Photobacterium sp. SDRW27]|uniref:universal stress protein n=1 Tax=Photobacterium obscurum TaxID=2829490 RepID=UPI0022439F15|nr:universal stress protein [Photobacterium obscurum]MCW8328441.1 universal stress protein [Photobacterium obscurum]